jgi:acid phosphatase type 7
MDGLKVLAGPSGGYLGVYHFPDAHEFVTAVATSGDLRHWTYQHDLSQHASQPTISATPDGGYVVAFEADNHSLSDRPSRWLRFLHYSSLHTLLSGTADRAYDARHTLGGSVAGAEGTPSLEGVQLTGNIDNSVVRVRFHFLTNGTDREAQGTLTNFRTWTTSRDRTLDAALLRAGASGKHGGRDRLDYRGRPFLFVEGYDLHARRWHIYLYDLTTHTARALPIKTAKGSRSFANPSVTALLLPSGTPTLVVAAFLPRAGAASGEIGELVYYRALGQDTRPAPVAAASGDIACPAGAVATTVTCQHAATAQLLERMRPDTVLALGDVQYEQGSLHNFEQAYAPTWGRYKQITHPALGNHDHVSNGSTGYFQYFGKAAGQDPGAHYAFDVGTWHLIALNSECGSVAVSCAEDGEQARWLANDLDSARSTCTLAFWHRPLFTSGREGPTPATSTFWDLLYKFGGDIVLNGHDHDYERFSPQRPDGTSDVAGGITQFVVGTGGKSLTGFSSLARNSTARLSHTFGVLELMLLPDGVDWHFYAADGSVDSDDGSEQCH